MFKLLNRLFGYNCVTMSNNVVRGNVAGRDMIQIGGNGNKQTMTNVSGGGTIEVNGKLYSLPVSAKNVSIVNGNIYIDGKKFDGTKNIETVNIHINTVGEFSGSVFGNVTIDSLGIAKEISTSSGDVTINKVTGSPCAISISTSSGNVKVEGNAHDIKTVSGDVEVSGEVLGSINSVSGDISHRKK